MKRRDSERGYGRLLWLGVLYGVVIFGGSTLYVKAQELSEDTPVPSELSSDGEVSPSDDVASEEIPTNQSIQSSSTEKELDISPDNPSSYHETNISNTSGTTSSTTEHSDDRAAISAPLEQSPSSSSDTSSNAVSSETVSDTAVVSDVENNLAEDNTVSTQSSATSSTDDASLSNDVSPPDTAPSNQPKQNTPSDSSPMNTVESSSTTSDEINTNTKDNNLPNNVGDNSSPDNVKSEESSCDDHAVRIVAVTIGDADSTKNDSVIIRNITECDVSLHGWYLRKRTRSQHGEVTRLSTSTKVYTFGDTVLHSGEQFIYAPADSRYASRADGVNTSVSARLSPNNSIALLDDKRVVVDAVAWGDALRDPFGATPVRNPGNEEYVAHGNGTTTIARRCTHPILRTVQCPPSYDGARVVINELYPNPSGDEQAEEYIELYNMENRAVSLHAWVLSDVSGARYVFDDHTTLMPQSLMVVSRRTFGFALNNSAERVTLSAPTEDGGETIVDTVEFSRSAPEGASLNRTTEGAYRWSKKRTPGAANMFNARPQIVSVNIPDTIYRNVRASFSVRATDDDGDALRYRWDFGDGHRSYRAKTSHLYKRTGTYTVHLRIQDGSEETVQTEVVRVRTYPRHAVKIRAVAPNPPGADTGTEYIVIKNTSDARVDLRGWSIATGTTMKQLTRHPFRRRIVLHDGEEKHIVSRHSAFTLPNAGGIVQLRRPDDSVAYTVRYMPPANTTTIPSGAVYRRRAHDSGWYWDISAVNTVQSSASRKFARAIATPDVSAIIARAWDNEFGVPNAPRVAGAKVVTVHDAGVVVPTVWENIRVIMTRIVPTLSPRPISYPTTELIPRTGRAAVLPAQMPDPAALYAAAILRNHGMMNTQNQRKKELYGGTQ